jgi:hypothetical protein
MGVRAEVHDGAADRPERLVLRVWGGGVSRQLPIVTDAGPRDSSVQFHSSPRATRHYYFAQLEDSAGRPVSEVYPLKTYAKELGSCAKNLIRLVFDRQQ